MYTYTTPTITCKFNGVTWTNVDYVRIAIKGKGTQLLRTVPVADIDTSTGTAVVHLTQEETAQLGQGQVGVQARIHYVDGTVQATNKVIRQIDDVYDKVVI